MSRKKNDQRPFFYSLFFTKSHDMDLSWFMSLVIVFLTMVCVFGEILTGTHLSNALYTLLGGMFFTVLVSAVPINKARLLVQSKAGDIFSNIASANVSPSNPDAGLITEIGDLLKSDPTGKKSIAQALNESSGSL